MFTVGDMLASNAENKMFTREEYEAMVPVRKGTKTVPVVRKGIDGVVHKAWGRKLVIRYNTFVKRSEKYWGFCIHCGYSGAKSGNDCGLEPDARNYPCPKCKRDKMMGYEEALMSNFAEVV